MPLSVAPRVGLAIVIGLTFLVFIVPLDSGRFMTSTALFSPLAIPRTEYWQW
jgi:hypothetical protein